MDDWGPLILRVVVGLLFIGHGSQKLFGWFGGSGLAGTAAWLRTLGLRFASLWALAAGVSELSGGALVLFGLLGPLGPLAITASMLVAIITVHWPHGLWNERGGSELPLTNIAIAVALAVAGPGAYALDPLLGIVLPMPATLLGGALLVLGGVALVALNRSGTVAVAHASSPPHA